MSDADFNANLISEGLEVLFEDVMPRTITAPAITENQDRSSVGIMVFTVGVPPVAKAIASEFTGVMASSLSEK